MLELALLIVLVGSVCFLTYEFFKINQVYQERMHYYRFLPSLSMPEMTKELNKGTTDSESKLRMSDMDYKMKEIQASIERQEAVIEKLIKGLGD
ncbi:MAG: hypothetical protein NTY20_01710 [Candidatus Aenigmarchaeota archaeon]|nr:hypothetical protein [Candidatus Aenigmarchaeota archaeon]